MSCNCEDTNNENLENECECTDCKCYQTSESQIDTDDECGCDPCHCSDCSCDEVSEPEDDTSTDDYTENDDKHCILHGRWIYDGSNSIDEMIEALQREIALLEDLKQDGWVLQEKVVNDNVYFEKVDEE
jgi:hypothetical protein